MPDQTEPATAGTRARDKVVTADPAVRCGVHRDGMSRRSRQRQRQQVRLESRRLQRIHQHQPERGAAVLLRDTAHVVAHPHRRRAARRIRRVRLAQVRLRLHQRTSSGRYALDTHQAAPHITERCVFTLTPKGLQLTEIAPGLDLERDVLTHIGFDPVIVGEPALMDPESSKPTPWTGAGICSTFHSPIDAPTTRPRNRLPQLGGASRFARRPTSTPSKRRSAPDSRRSDKKYRLWSTTTTSISPEARRRLSRISSQNCRTFLDRHPVQHEFVPDASNSANTSFAAASYRICTKATAKRPRTRSASEPGLPTRQRTRERPILSPRPADHEGK